MCGRDSHDALRVTPSGQIDEVIDSRGAFPAGWLLVGLHHPVGVACAPNGDVFVAGCPSDNVFRIPPRGGIGD